MGLSNYIPSSRIAQSGVCTSTTRPATPYEGQMIYETDTNRVLVYDNTAWVMIADTDSPPGLQLVKSGTLSLTTTATNVTDVFNADFKQYRLLLNITDKSASIRVDMKYIVGTTATSTGYYQAGIGSDYTFNNTLYYQRSNNDSQFFGVASSALLSYSLDIYNVNKAALTMHHGTLVDANTGFPYLVGGSQNSSNQFTGFQLFTSTGTATVEYQVFGYRN